MLFQTIVSTHSKNFDFDAHLHVEWGPSTVKRSAASRTPLLKTFRLLPGFRKGPITLEKKYACAKVAGCYFCLKLTLIQWYIMTTKLCYKKINWYKDKFSGRQMTHWFYKYMVSSDCPRWGATTQVFYSKNDSTVSVQIILFRCPLNQYTCELCSEKIINLLFILASEICIIVYNLFVLRVQF